MSSNQLLSLFTQLFYVALGLLTFVDWSRHRTPIRRDIALAFNAIGVPIGIDVIEIVSKSESLTATFAAAFVLISQPFLILRLVRHFRPVPVVIMRATAFSMIICWVFLLLYFRNTPVLVSLYVLAYIVIVNGYAMLSFVRGAMTTAGVVRRRLRFAAVGSGLLALALLLSNMGNVGSSLNGMVQAFALFAAAGSVYCFYLGFLPTQGLRRTWQLIEFHHFLRSLTEPSAFNNATEVYKQLQMLIPNAVGTARVEVLISDDQDAKLIPINTSEIEPATDIQFENETLIEQAWRTRTARLVRASNLSKQLIDQLSIGAEGIIFLVPIVRAEQAWALLLVIQPQASLFPDDDLAILALIAEQSALILENIELIESLRQKSTHLEAVNKEIEAFSYAVSHDLRAPLRSLDGFSLALLEDFHDQLDDSGRDYLGRVRAASQRMGQLIDDMMKLSRVTRSEIHWETVDLSTMIQNIIEDIKVRETRDVEVVVEDDCVAYGDTQLIRILLENLIGNAWKFTRKKSDARIEFGRTVYREQSVYYLRDNGAGFDMTYANKLFGAFQRLHHASEYEGTGIGLATTQRVVNRHGGAIWAEGKVNHGATFYFTLQLEQDTRMAM